MLAFIKKTAIAQVIVLLLSALLSINLSSNSEKYSDKALDPGDYENVILMIGDGMGAYHVDWMEQEYGISQAAMYAMTDYHGWSKTRSSSNEVTDSAAGGTALACAIRTNNGAIGMFPQDGFGFAYVPMNLCELANSMGKMTGVVTSDKNCGATPSSFSAHVANRDMEEEITKQQIENSKLDLIWGAASGFVTDEYAQENGWSLVDSKADFAALEEGTRSFGQFEGDLWNSETGADSPSLSVLTEKAIDMLDDDEDGFFLMVEGAHIDKHSHSNDAEKMKKAAYEFDLAIKEALEFAKEEGNTLVVITADHETGAISSNNGEFKYNSGSHSAADVPLLVYGSDNFVKEDEAINNKEVARRLSMAIGADPGAFPAAVKVE